jgi:hypothetical protein
MGLGGAAEEAFGGGETGAIRDASRAQSEAANRSIDLQREIFNKQLELGRPYQVAGEQALNKLVPLALEYTPFGMQQFQADPGYGFRLSEGQKALERSTAARVGLQSGAALKAAARYGQEMGSQEFQNAFNRFQAEREARLNPLQSLAGVGQTTSNRLSDTAGTFGRSVGGMYMDQGSNTANALLAAQRARGSAYGQLGSALGGYLGGGGGFGPAGFGRGGQMDELRSYGVF